MRRICTMTKMRLDADMPHSMKRYLGMSPAMSVRSPAPCFILFSILRAAPRAGTPDRPPDRGGPPWDGGNLATVPAAWFSGKDYLACSFCSSHGIDAYCMPRRVASILTVVRAISRIRSIRQQSAILPAEVPRSEAPWTA